MMFVSKLKTYSVLALCIFTLANTVVFSGCGKKKNSSTGSVAQEQQKGSDEGRPIYTEGDIILAIYQMVKDIHEVFEKHDITYWAEGGTLIGAMRHNGQIPWDDDADLCLLPGHEVKLFSEVVVKEFSDAGYVVRDHGNLTYRILKKGEEFPFVDLFKMDHVDDKFVYSLACWGKRNGENMYILEDEVMPVAKHKFGLYKINVPKRSMDFLYDYFGDDVMDIGYSTHVHHNVPGFKKIKFTLTDEDREPAQPLGPLKDRIPDVKK
jgi:hypothetical protein